MLRTPIVCFVILCGSNAYASEVSYWFGPVPYGATAEKAKTILGAKAEESISGKHAFVSYMDVVGGLESEVSYRLSDKRSVEAVIVKPKSVEVINMRECWDRFSNVFGQLKRKYGSPDVEPKPRAIVPSVGLYEERATFTKPSGKITASATMAKDKCFLSVSYERTASGSEF